MTASSDTTAPRFPSAGNPTAHGGQLLAWPSLVWLGGSLPWLAAWVRGTADPTAAAFLVVGLICFTATLASLLPIRNLVHGPTETLAVGLLATVAVRGGTTLCLLIAALALGYVERQAIAIPIVLWYMAFLVTDLVVINRFLSHALPNSGRPHSERTTC